MGVIEQISKTKVAYSRPGDNDTSLVIRDRDPNVRNNLFGTKGRQELEALYYALLGMLKFHRDDIVQNSKFDQSALDHLLTSLVSEDLQKIEETMARLAGEDNEQIKFEPIELRIILTDDYPRMSLFRKLGSDDSNETKSKSIGIYLFIEQVIAVLLYMNKNYDEMGTTKLTKFNPHVDDDFLDL